MDPCTLQVNKKTAQSERRCKGSMSALSSCPGRAQVGSLLSPGANFWETQL